MHNIIYIYKRRSPTEIVTIIKNNMLVYIIFLYTTTLCEPLIKTWPAVVVSILQYNTCVHVELTILYYIEIACGTKSIFPPCIHTTHTHTFHFQRNYWLREKIDIKKKTISHIVYSRYLLFTYITYMKWNNT